MTKPEAIKKMFPNKSKDELSELWEEIFIPEAKMINPVKLDNYLIEEYGEYSGSLADFIFDNFGDDVLKAVRDD